MKKTTSKKILVHAYGNRGRGDDGLGEEFINGINRWIETNDLRSLDTENSFQLTIEHAAAMAEYDGVIFIDASKADILDFSLQKITPELQQSFTSHSISPSTLVGLCTELYNRSPLVYLLQIKGYRWEFGIGLSDQAKENLQKALKFSFDFITDFQNHE